MPIIKLYFNNNLEGEYNIDKDVTTIGRSKDCDIVIDNVGISRHHCDIVRRNEQYMIVNKSSNKCLFMDGEQIDKKILAHKDRAFVGKHNILFDAYSSCENRTSEVKNYPSLDSSNHEMTMNVDRRVIDKAKELVDSVYTLVINRNGQDMRMPIVNDVVIGKGADADLPIKGMFVKTKQAQIISTDKGYRIISSGGLRSVKVNGCKVRNSILNDGDVVSVAGVDISFKSSSHY